MHIEQNLWLNSHIWNRVLRFIRPLKQLSGTIKARNTLDALIDIIFARIIRLSGIHSLFHVVDSKIVTIFKPSSIYPNFFAPSPPTPPATPFTPIIIFINQNRDFVSGIGGKKRRELSPSTFYFTYWTISFLFIFRVLRERSRFRRECRACPRRDIGRFSAHQSRLQETEKFKENNNIHERLFSFDPNLEISKPKRI